jgi:AcrR family transcriptional regulator
MAGKPRTALKKQAKQERSRATVDAILEAASHILVTRGYAKTSTTRIAARAGVSVGSLYQYFPGKEAIVAELIERHMTETFERVRAELVELAAAPLDGVVARVIELLFRAYSVNPVLHRVFVEQVPRVGRLARIQELERSLLQLATEYLEAHRDDLRIADPEIVAFVLFRSVAAVAYSVVVERKEAEQEAFASELTEFALRYLRGDSKLVDRGAQRMRR